VKKELPAKLHRLLVEIVHEFVDQRERDQLDWSVGTGCRRARRGMHQCGAWFQQSAKKFVSISREADQRLPTNISQMLIRNLLF
jgi:hypothetical protein